MSSIEDEVCRKIQERAAHGLNKYGKTMERNDLNVLDWVTHAQEEAMDLAVYLERLKQEIEKGVFHPNVRETYVGNLPINDLLLQHSKAIAGEIGISAKDTKSNLGDQ
jgi:hypothetical protein